MEGCRYRYGRPFREAVERFHSLGAVYDDATGERLSLPGEVLEAEIIVGLAERFHVLPSKVLDEPVELLRLIILADMAKPEAKERSEPDPDPPAPGVRNLNMRPVDPGFVRS